MARLWEGPEGCGLSLRLWHMGNQHGVGRGAGTKKGCFLNRPLVHTHIVCACGEQI